MANARYEGLKAASAVLARVMKRVAGVKTHRTADAVRVTFEGDEAAVSAGRPEGAWGWEPIQALMFDDDKRHPLFGDRRHWYHQGEYPITAETVRIGADDAADAYADAAIDLMLDEHGFPK
jgi:hypothetical protein